MKIFVYRSWFWDGEVLIIAQDIQDARTTVRDRYLEMYKAKEKEFGDKFPGTPNVVTIERQAVEDLTLELEKHELVQGTVITADEEGEFQIFN